MLGSGQSCTLCGAWGEGEHRFFPLPSIPSRQGRGDFLEFWRFEFEIWSLFGICNLGFGI